MPAIEEEEEQLDSYTYTRKPRKHNSQSLQDLQLVSPRQNTEKAEGDNEKHQRKFLLRKTS